MKFRLVKGKHYHRGKLYVADTKDDVVVSDTELDKVFVNKFKRLSGGGTPSVKKKPNIPRPEDVGVGGKGDAKDTSPEPLDDEIDEDEDTGIIEDEDTGIVEDDDSSLEELVEYPEYGENITADFPKAEELGVVVCKKKNWYTIIDIDDDSILTAKGIREKAVVPFLKQLEKEMEANEGE